MALGGSCHVLTRIWVPFVASPAGLGRARLRKMRGLSLRPSGPEVSCCPFAGRPDHAHHRPAPFPAGSPRTWPSAWRPPARTCGHPSISCPRCRIRCGRTWSPTCPPTCLPASRPPASRTCGPCCPGPPAASIRPRPGARCGTTWRRPQRPRRRTSDRARPPSRRCSGRPSGRSSPCCASSPPRRRRACSSTPSGEPAHPHCCPTCCAAQPRPGLVIRSARENLAAAVREGVKVWSPYGGTP